MRNKNSSLGWALIVSISCLLAAKRVLAQQTPATADHDALQHPAVPMRASTEQVSPPPDTSDPLIDPTLVTLEQPKAESHSELPNRLGPASISINPQGDRVSLGLTTQTQFNLNQQFAGGGASKARDHSLAFRRLRFVLGGSFLNDRVRSSLQLNLMPGALELMDFWISVSPQRYSYATFRFGQYKIPFTRYRAQSFSVLSMTDWSPLTRWFGAERQLGLEVFNSAASISGWEYVFGIFTGMNARGSHAVGLTEYYGNRPVNPSNLAGPAIPAQLHPEFVGRIARNFGKIDTSESSDLARGPLRASFGLSGTWDLQPVAQEDFPMRLAAEALIKVHGLYINAVNYMGWFKGTQGTDFGSIGLLLESGYRFDRTWELALRYSGLLITDALQQDAQAYAAANPTAENTDVGRRSSDQEFALAGTSYVIGNSLKFQLEGAWRTMGTLDGRRNALRLTAQLQFQF